MLEARRVGRRHQVLQEGEGVADAIDRATPAGLEAELLEPPGDRDPVVVSGDLLERLQGVGNRGPQTVDGVQPRVDHELVGAARVQRQEAQQLLEAALAVGEEAAGQPAIQVLAAATDPVPLARPRQLVGERAEVDLERPGVLLVTAGGEALASAQVLRGVDLDHPQGLGVEAQPAPAADRRASGEVEPGRVDGRLLGTLELGLEGAAGEGGNRPAVSRQPPSDVGELGTEQELLAGAEATVEQRVHGVPVLPQQHAQMVDGHEPSPWVWAPAGSSVRKP